MPFLRPSIIALLVLLGGITATLASLGGLTAAVAASVLVALLALAFAARLPGNRTMAPMAQVDVVDEPSAEQRLAELEATTSTLRHDVRGALSPALLVADRLLDSPEPATKRAAEIVVASIERVEQRLAETRDAQGAPAPDGAAAAR